MGCKRWFGWVLVDFLGGFDDWAVGCGLLFCGAVGSVDNGWVWAED